MKRLAAVLCMCMTFSVYAQEQATTSTTILAINSPAVSNVIQDSPSTLASGTDGYTFLVGSYLVAKGSVKTEVAEGFKTGPLFGADMGITTLFPFGKGSNFGAGFDLGHATYGYIVKPENEDSATDFNTVQERYNYINFAPFVYVAGFTLGINVGFPNYAYGRYIEGRTVNLLTDSSGIALRPGLEVTKFLSTLLEVRLGGMIPLITTETGRLNLNLQAGYVLSGMYNDYKNYYGAYDMTESNGVRFRGKPRENLNPQVVSGSIGISYLFNVRP